MAPKITSPNQPYQVSRHTKLFGDILLPRLAAETDNLLCLGLRQLGERAALPNISSSVLPFICMVLRARRPAEVAGVDTQPVAASVSSLAALWRWTMRPRANNPMGVNRSPSNLCAPIAALHNAERPNQTFITLEANRLIQKMSRRAAIGFSALRVSVLPPSLVMRAAKAALPNRLVAIGHRAYRSFSHSVSPHVVVRAGRCANSGSGPIFLSGSLSALKRDVA